jgi:putative thioredoxin
VVVDFWATWCGPCRALGPLLERLAREGAGEFVLAKVDVDRNPLAAQSFAVRSIPTVIGFKDGAPAASFVGAQPERAVREFLAQLAPSAADRLVVEAERLSAAGETAVAESRLREALALEARNPAALLALARRLAERGEAAEAQALLARVSADGPLAAEAERLAARLRTAAASAAELDPLRARVKSSPRDPRAWLELGRALAARGEYEAALEPLLESVRLDSRQDDEAARRAILDVFALLGPEHPATAKGRSELAKALFR